MKFKDLLTNILYEQHMPPNPEDPEIDPEDEEVHMDDNGNVVDAHGNIIEPALDDNGAEQLDEPVGDMEDNPLVRQTGPRQNPEAPKKLTAVQQIKMRWIREHPGLSDFEMDEAIGFFRDRRDGLRPYHPYGYIDPQTNRHYINTPEITSIVQQFPSMAQILEKPETLRDLKNYPWEVMSYYMNMIQATNAIVDMENLVPGTRLSLEEQLRLAKEKWKKASNQIINENGTIVYKIESQNESIEFGSIQRVLNKIRHENGNSRGNAYWCTTVPLNDKDRSNLWTNYRPKRAFYYIWDQNRDEEDRYYCSSIQVSSPGHADGPYIFVDLYNSTSMHMEWNDIIEIYPQFANKKKLFQYFGITSKEKIDITIDKITFRLGDSYYFGSVPKSYQHAYVESGRHVKQVQAFLTMDPSTRKLYVDKTTKLNNDLINRYVCDDPNDPFGILEVLRVETKPENLYKYLNDKILISILNVPDGILAIKKSIIGQNWRRWVSDDSVKYTLISPRSNDNKYSRNTAYGIINMETGDIIKDIQYVQSLPQAFVEPYLGDDGQIRRDRQYIFQKYSYSLGNRGVDQNESFYFLFRKEAMIKRDSEFYLKGKYFEKEEGENFIQDKISTGQFKKI